MRSTRGAVQFDRDLFSVVCFFCGGFLENDGRCICFGLLVSLSLLFKLCFATASLPDSIGIRGKSQMKIKDVQNVRFLPFKWSD